MVDWRTGNPTPEVTWWQEERMIDRHAEIRHSEQGVARNVLQLERLGRVDLRTKLSCHASNTQLSQPLTKSVEIELNRKSYTPTTFIPFCKPLFRLGCVYTFVPWQKVSDKQQFCYFWVCLFTGWPKPKGNWLLCLQHCHFFVCSSYVSMKGPKSFTSFCLTTFSPFSPLVIHQTDRMTMFFSVRKSLANLAMIWLRQKQTLLLGRRLEHANSCIIFFRATI